MAAQDEQSLDRMLEILAAAGGSVGLGVEDFERREDAISIRPAGIVVELTEPRDGRRRWRLGFFYEMASLGGAEPVPRRETLRIEPIEDVTGVAKAALVAAAEKMIDRAIDARS